VTLVPFGDRSELGSGGFCGRVILTLCCVLRRDQVPEGAMRSLATTPAESALNVPVVLPRKVTPNCHLAFMMG
jgi:hypothetical protein